MVSHGHVIRLQSSQKWWVLSRLYISQVKRDRKNSLNERLICTTLDKCMRDALLLRPYPTSDAIYSDGWIIRITTILNISLW